MLPKHGTQYFLPFTAVNRKQMLKGLSSGFTNHPQETSRFVTRLPALRVFVLLPYPHLPTTLLSSLQRVNCCLCGWRGLKFSSWLASVCKANHSTCAKVGVDETRVIAMQYYVKNVRAKEQPFHEKIPFRHPPRTSFPNFECETAARGWRSLCQGLPPSVLCVV
jgi:hypothetical protein